MKDKGRISRRAILALIFYLVASMGGGLRAQMSEPIALPKGAVEGRLPNGFRYLILPNKVPYAKVEFRLIMKMGSLQETETEKGCAHFLEHIAFGGTRHFPKRTLVSSLEKLGMKYGQDINAFTGFDRTIYMFAVPVDRDKDKVIRLSLQIIRDWMDGMTINPEKVRNEKDIILEELRSYDLGDDFYDLKIGNGRFSQRMPLGSAKDIQKVTPKALRGFYHKWYVPELATLVVVGDITPEDVEPRIKRMFSPLVTTETFVYPTTYKLTYPSGISVKEVRDDLRTTTKMEWMIPHPSVVERTLGDVVLKQRGRLLLKAINARLKGRGLTCDISNDWYLSDKDHFVIALEGRERKSLKDLTTRVIQELHCLVREGWQEEEWREIRDEFCRAFEACDTYESPRSSASRCDDFVDYIISGDKYLTDPSQHKEVGQVLRSTSSEDLQQMLAEWMAYKEDALLVACRSHPDFGDPLSAAEVEEIWLQGASRDCLPYHYVPKQQTTVQEVSCAPACLSVRPSLRPNLILERKKYEGIGVEEITLKNGIKLVLRPTHQADSTLILTSFAPHGLSSISADDYPLLEGTASYMDMGGIAKVSGDKLAEYLYQKDMALSTVIDNHWHGFMGMAPSSSALEFFNLIYEKIVDPELNHEDFEESRKEQLSRLGKETPLSQMLKRDLFRRLTARTSELMGLSLPIAQRQVTADDLHRLDLGKVAAFYKSLYTDPRQTTYVISGNFDPDVIAPLFVSILGRLAPSEQVSRQYASFAFPKGKTTEYFASEGEEQAQFSYLFYGNYTPGLCQSLRLKLMCHLIRNRLIDILREQETLVYSPYVTLEYEAIPWGTFHFNVNASCDLDNIPQIQGCLTGILKGLQTTKVDETELESIKRSFLITKRETLDETAAAAWRTTLSTLLKNGESLADFEAYESLLSEITPEMLRDAFERLIDVDRYTLLYISDQPLK